MGNMIKMVNWNTVELERKHSIHSNEHAMTTWAVVSHASPPCVMGWRTGLIQQLFYVLLVSQRIVHYHSSNECAVHTHHSNVIVKKFFTHTRARAHTHTHTCTNAHMHRHKPCSAIPCPVGCSWQQDHDGWSLSLRGSSFHLLSQDKTGAASLEGQGPWENYT